MKNILILTDFSANAKHAALTGTMLAKRLHTDILLFHANTTQSVAPVYAGGPTVIDEIDLMEVESKEKLQKLADFLKPFAESRDSAWQPAIRYEEGLGALGYQARNIIETKKIEMIIMGARKGSPMDHFLTGSETFSVIDHVNRPVLVLPSDTDLHNLKKVIFATNFAEADIKAVHYLNNLASVFNFHLQVVHINPPGDDDITLGLRKIEFMKHFQRLSYTGVTVSDLQGKDIVNRLNRLCNESGTDLLSFTHYRNSVFSRFFHQSMTHKALEKQKIPMLIFPSHFHA